MPLGVPALPIPSQYAAGPPPAHSGQVPATTVYNYVNPLSGERVVSLLPPDHPQMVCLQQGGHSSASKFGILGEWWTWSAASPSPCLAARER